MPIEPGQTFGQYHIQEKLGEGGMGVVFKAQQSGVNRAVVVKVLLASVKDNPQMLERFKRELDIIAQLEHPHILPVYDFGEYEGNPYIVMRYMGGGSLLDALRTRALNREQLLHAFAQIAAALDYAHGRNIIHRDLKPANILLDDRGNAYLADFGLARTLEGDASLTKTGSILGTPAYMSPEQGRGEKLDPRSDIYSLAVMIFEALTGQPLFTADTAWKLITKHLTETPRAITSLRPDLPAAIETVFDRALAKDRSERPARAGDFVESVRAALVEHPALAATPTQPSTQAPVAPRTGLPSAARVSVTPPATFTTTLPKSAAVAIPIMLLVGLGAVVLVIAAVGIGLYLLRDSLFPAQVAVYPIGDSPRAILYADQDIWIANGFSNSVVRLNAANCTAQPDSCGQALGTYVVDQLPVGLAVDGDSLWVASALNRKLSKLNRTTGEVIATYQLTSVPSTLLLAHGYLWTANEIASTVTQIGLDGAIVGDYAIAGGPLALTAAPTAIWVAAKESKTLIQLDPTNGQILNTLAVEGKPVALVYDDQSLWVGYEDRSEIDQITAAGQTQKVSLSAAVIALYFDGQRVWATLADSTLIAISAQAKIVLTQTLDFKPYTLTVTACGQNCADAWILSEANDTVNRIRVTQ